MPEPTKQALADEAEIQQAHQRFKLIKDADEPLRQRQLADWKFVDEDYGQWDAQQKKDREADGRPCIQIDRTSGQIRQVSNRIMEARPAIQISPVDNGADLHKAEVRQGVVRYIEDESEADYAYALAVEHILKFGRGAWRLVPEYIHQEHKDEAQLFKQEPRIRALENPFGVYLDPRPNLYGPRFGFVPEDLDPEDYNARFGEESLVGLETMRGSGDAVPDWFPKGKVRICEYFYVVSTFRTVTMQEGERTITRKVETRQVKWCLINAVKVLERRDIPGPYIPIIVVEGERSVIDGVVDVKGLVRRAKDPQRMVNYGRSKTVEAEALAPSAPFIAAWGQIEPYQKYWDTANRRNWSYLPYEPIGPAGDRLPPPQRNFGEPPIQALLGMSREFENDLRASMQMPDIQGQELRREQSGKAIKFRDMLSEAGNAHFAANLRRAIVLTGKILNAWIPVYFDVPTQLQIVGKDGKPREVIVHAGNQAAIPTPPPENIDPKDIVDLNVGRFDVKVSTGPSYQSQRQENRDQLGEILAKNPELMPLFGDLFFENWDDPIGQQIAKRIRKSNPALAEEDGAEKPQIPPEFLQQHEQLIQAVQQLTEERDAKLKELESEEKRKGAELASKEKLAQMDDATERAIAAAKLEVEREIAMLKIEHERDMAAMKVEMAKQQMAMDAASGEADRGLKRDEHAMAHAHHSDDVELQREAAQHQEAEG